MTGAGRMNRGPYPAARKDGSDRRLRARGGLAIRRHPTIPCAPRADQLFCVPLQWLVLKCPHVAGSEVPADRRLKSLVGFLLLVEFYMVFLQEFLSQTNLVIILTVEMQSN